MHPQYSPQDEEDDQHDAIPDEVKDHMWAAFAHKAGVGPHPGIYNRPKDKPEAITQGPSSRHHQSEKGAEVPATG
jgi:hypothetical protein